MMYQAYGWLSVRDTDIRALILLDMGVHFVADAKVSLKGKKNMIEPLERQIKK